MSGFKKGQRVVLTGTVERVQEQTQHPGYVVVELDASVVVVHPDGLGGSGALVQIDPAGLRQMNPSDLERRDPSDDYDPQDGLTETDRSRIRFHLRRAAK